MPQNSLTLRFDEAISDALPLEPVVQKSLLSKAAKFERSSIEECLEVYGDLVWCLAKKHTRTTVEAERAVREIFLDVWKYADRFDAGKFDEQSFVALVALRRLLKNNEQSRAS